MSIRQVQPFPLAFGAVQQAVQISADAIPVHFFMNDNIPTMSAYTDPTLPTTRKFTIFNDNVAAPTNAVYVDSLEYQQSVYHLFETP